MTPFLRSTTLAALTGGAALLLAACGQGTDKADNGAANDAASTASATPDTATPPASTPAPSAATTAPLPPTVGTKLAAYVGKYPFDKVDGVTWNDHPIVKAGIAATVRDAKVREAITTISGPAAPIEMQDGKVMAWACEAHNCGPHQWAVLIDPRTGAADVCYYDEAASAADSRWFLASGKEEKRAGNCQGSGE
jgi:hypothetical protein